MVVRQRPARVDERLLDRALDRVVLDERVARARRVDREREVEARARVVGVRQVAHHVAATPWSAIARAPPRSPRRRARAAPTTARRSRRRRRARRGRAGSRGCRACRTSSGRRARRAAPDASPPARLDDRPDELALRLDVAGAALVADEREAHPPGVDPAPLQYGLQGAATSAGRPARRPSASRTRTAVGGASETRVTDGVASLAAIACIASRPRSQSGSR